MCFVRERKNCIARIVFIGIAVSAYFTSILHSDCEHSLFNLEYAEDGDLLYYLLSLTETYLLTVANKTFWVFFQHSSACSFDYKTVQILCCDGF